MILSTSVTNLVLNHYALITFALVRSYQGDVP